MKKLVPVIVAAVILAGGAAAYLATKKDDNGSPPTTKPPTSQSESSTKKFEEKKACDVLTLDDAKKVLGDKAEAGSTNTNPPTDSDDVLVSTCTYGDGNASFSEGKSATVLVRAAKSEAGANSNKSQFGAQKPAGAQDVSGYGDAAYWSPSFGQFNVLKNNNWYIVSNGSIKVTERTLDQAKQLADVIAPKLK